MTPIRTLLIEDSHDYRHVIQFAFQDDPGITFAGVFGTAEQAIRSLQNDSGSLVPDLILLDLSLPGMAGLEALPLLAALAPEARILVLTQSERADDVLTAVRLGASGYLLKSLSFQDLRQGIHTVMEGGASVDPHMARFLLEAFRPQSTTSEQSTPLSEREHEILVLISEGFLRKEIACRLDISPKTVANHIAHIFEKLNVPNSPAAIHKAHRLGLLEKPRR
ncbi:response regulator [Roseibacillus ishigakijimensis]|uniref:Response regulator transcription factor n=1 Tax=Roseibacillus ishigakijimensis TaxID=454146 RepID=A0A934RPG0_9BACT|nr:response regulator transcription factor [Roseibacillus ishigakijimensis]MBK1834565.1 response regulator transcription factor [Roseibacillus ishigakijimensis]